MNKSNLNYRWTDRGLSTTWTINPRIGMRESRKLPSSTPSSDSGKFTITWNCPRISPLAVIWWFSRGEDSISFFNKKLKLYLTTNFSDIEPKWECPENRQGGRLVAEMTKEHRNDCMSTNWLNTILGLIGEECAHENVARCVGVQFQSRKKMDKISMWVASGHSKIEIKNLGGFMLGEFRFSFLDSK